ncbi:MAG: hypothetical protein DRP70_11420 [Spirochaetes bacterium]|nr:MAG: hypothetical protein DRP70_11420 [Spirochaetota bacterium]
MYIEEKQAEVWELLETSYGIDLNTVEKITRNSFTKGQLPPWFLFSKSAEEISQLIYVSSQILNADMDHLTVTSDDGKEITYFINIGRDVPGKLSRILEENSALDIISFDSVKIGSGRRIVTLEKQGRSPFSVSKEIEDEKTSLIEEVNKRSSRLKYRYTSEFIASLPPNYLNEEANSEYTTGRIHRHLDLFEIALNENRPQYRQDSVTEDEAGIGEIRISIAYPNPASDFTLRVLDLVHQRGMNLNRTFWDLFRNDASDSSVGILSLYFGTGIPTMGFKDNLEILFKEFESDHTGDIQNNSDWEKLIRGLSTPGVTQPEIAQSMSVLYKMASDNSDIEIPGDELAENLLLNALSGFFDAAETLGFNEESRVLADLISFERFDEFWVNTVHKGVQRNAEGFRVKHSTDRGPCKGGIRNALIVDFAEVSGLSFLMTWKCARTGILFGGGKGGLKINPSDFASDKIDLFDTLSSFGRSLFLVTGPARDVPAGDVGCGASEIGQMFEGFKSALHDLALIAYGVKKSGAVLGHKVISLKEARTLLSESFDIDVHDPVLMEKLTSSEKYLELVAAAHITGKPRMGIDARTGATGRGLCVTILATVANEYAAGRWEAARELTVEESSEIQALTELTRGGLEREDWKKLGDVFGKLLEGKRVIVQGSGKVGSSLIEELSVYGVNIVGVADRDGAILGEKLDVEELLKLAKSSGSVVGSKIGVDETISGAAAGSGILARQCDILVLAALENAVTTANVAGINAPVIACGSNGPITPKAENLLHQRGVTVIYDFLANSGGVTASYFEWLRNLSDRFRYESEVIRGENYNPDKMTPYVMPEYSDRIKAILSQKESGKTTQAWNDLIRDILIIAVNNDYRKSSEYGKPMKVAGFVDSLLKVLSARLMKAETQERWSIWENLPEKAKKALLPYMNHPESQLYNPEAVEVARELSGSLSS